MAAEHLYLAERARLAKAGLRTEAKGLAEDLMAPLQLRALVRRHPRLGVGSAALLGVLLGRGIRGPRTKPATDQAAPRLATAMGQRLRRLLGSTFGALWLSWLRSPPAGPPAGANDTAPDAAAAIARDTAPDAAIRNGHQD